MKNQKGKLSKYYKKVKTMEHRKRLQNTFTTIKQSVLFMLTQRQKANITHKFE